MARLICSIIPSLNQPLFLVYSYIPSLYQLLFPVYSYISYPKYDVILGCFRVNLGVGLDFTANLQKSAG